MLLPAAQLFVDYRDLTVRIMIRHLLRMPPASLHPLQSQTFQAFLDKQFLAALYPVQKWTLELLLIPHDTTKVISDGEGLHHGTYTNTHKHFQLTS